MNPKPYNPEAAIQQLYPGLSLEDCLAWYQWIHEQPNYYIAQVGQATCITKVFDQLDPPWLRMAQEVAWWGQGRDAVRALHRGMAWARLQRATHYGYSLAPQFSIVKWKRL